MKKTRSLLVAAVMLGSGLLAGGLKTLTPVRPAAETAKTTAPKQPDVARLEHLARERWAEAHPAQAKLRVKPGSYLEVAHLVSERNWKQLSAPHKTMVRRMMLDARAGVVGAAPCFAPGTPGPTVDTFDAISNEFGFFRTQGYWSSTASGSHTTGARATIRWSVVPDGTTIYSANGEPTSTSDLRAKLNALYGSEDTWRPILRQVFASWSAVAGINYVEEANDDGSPVNNTYSYPGVAGVRGDVRISGHYVDGVSNILAYNYYPDQGDMIVDTGDFASGGFFTNTASNSLGFRNTLAHEHGHGLGFAHVCPVNQTKLMEPYASSNFDGPQIDDILNAQRGYGDPLEENDSTSGATDLGTLSNGSTSKTTISLDGSSDNDYFKFAVSGSKYVTATVTPQGGSYLESSQATCGTSSTTFNASSQRDLQITLLDGTGATVATANSTTTGSAETLSATAIHGNFGPYQIKVSGDSADLIQLYNLSLTLSDGPPAISIGDVSQSEGLLGTSTFQFPVTLSASSSNTVTVNYATSDGTASTGSDYTSTSGTLTFAPGETSKNVSVTVKGDFDVESDETFTVALSGNTNSIILDGTATGTIQNDDTGSTCPASPASIPYTEGFETGALPAAWNSYSTGNGRVLVTGSNSPHGGSNHVTLDSSSGNAANEALLTLNLSGKSGITLSFWHQSFGDTQDAMPASFSGHGNYDGVAISAGDGTWYRVDSLASDPANTYKQHTLDLDAAIASAGISYSSCFQIKFQQYGNNSIANGQGRAFDDIKVTDVALPTLSVADATVTETDSGTDTTADFTVTLSSASSDDVTVNYATADGTAVTGSDYTATSGTLTFTAGQTSKTISVPILGDNTDEDDETLSLTLSSPFNATLADGTATGTITDNDVPPQAGFNQPNVTEGTGEDKSLTFSLTLGATSGRTVTVDYTTVDGTALAGSDYTAKSGTLTFAPGEITKTIDVVILGDSTDEAEENLSVKYSNFVNATIGPGVTDPAATLTATGTITDDDAAPSLSVADASGAEGTATNGSVSLDVTLSAASEQTVTVGYATAAGTAISDTDYTATSGTLTFAPGETSKTVTVSTLADAVDETDETFTLTLSSPTNATILDGTATGTISDDDTATISIGDVSVLEGNASGGILTFNITLSTASDRSVTVDFAAKEGTASAGVDYVDVSGSVAFSPGQTSKSITVFVLGDTTPEPDETLTIELSNPANAAITDGSGTGTITNDDLPVLSVTSASVSEGNSGTKTLSFAATLPASFSQTASVYFVTSNTTATAGTDYLANSATLNFSPGETSKTIDITINGDTDIESNETFKVSLSNPVNCTLARSSVTGTITNDDLPGLSITNVSTTEGNSGSTNATLKVTSSRTSPFTVTVNYATANNTATAGSDYTAQSGTLSFAPGETSKTIVVPVTGDTTVEATETYFVNLSGATNATLTDNQGQGTIVTDDFPTISVSDITVTEGNSGTTNATFTATLSTASPQSVSVNYATANMTAGAGSDYTATSGKVTFAAGTTTKTFTIPVVADTRDEPDEAFAVNLSSPSNALLPDLQATCTITDDDATPSFSINDVSLTEGNTGTSNLNFSIKLSAASGRALEVTYTTANGTANGTATAGVDYSAKTGHVPFSAGTTLRNISIPITGDILDEANETLFVNLTEPVNATISDAQGIGTITDDDAAPTLKISAGSVTEGNSGTKTLSMPVSLNAVSGQTVTVNYATSDLTATAGSDYTAASGTLTFSPGQTTRNVSLTVQGDTALETNETLRVTLTNPVNATIQTAFATGTITNDDLPGLSLNDVSVTEGNSGSASAIFTVTLSAAAPQSVTVAYATGDGTATAGTDYTAKTGTLTFAAGETSKSIAVPVLGETAIEANETFNVTLSSPTNATISDSQGTGTIVNNDFPNLTIADLTITEGSAGTSNATFTATLSASSPQSITVNYATVNGTAASGSDYTAASGKLTFAAGTTTQTITVPILGDVLDEANETFTVTLSGATNANLTDAEATGTITDDDATPTLSVNDVAVTEGTGSTKTASFSVTLSAVSGQAVSVNYATADGTAVSTEDYTTASGTLTFTPGTTVRGLSITVTGDALDEALESFAVNLSSPANATLADAQGLCSITDNDAAPTLSIKDVTLAEGNTGTTNAGFVLTLSTVSGQPITVDYGTADGTATAGSDYTQTNGTITFAPGETTKTINVPVKGDTTSEASETFFLNLTNPTNVTAPDLQAKATLTNDDSGTGAFRAPSQNLARLERREGKLS